MKITFMGAGSTVFARNVIGDCMCTEALRDSGAPRIIYVSCDPATLTRDLRVILRGGYAIEAVRMFDMFPRTAHFETAVLLRRNSQ